MSLRRSAAVTRKPLIFLNAVVSLRRCGGVSQAIENIVRRFCGGAPPYPLYAPRPLKRGASVCFEGLSEGLARHIHRDRSRVRPLAANRRENWRGRRLLPPQHKGNSAPAHAGAHIPRGIPQNNCASYASDRMVMA